MTNNDIIRRLRYIFEFDDSKMISLFEQAGLTVSRAEISNWLKREEDPDFNACDDRTLAIFLNGFIIDRRGKREGLQPAPETRLTNNLILTKLKIALELKAEDVLEIMEKADFSISKHELSAFFRRPDHKHYRECKDQILRKFLNGLKIKHRQDASETD